MLSILRQNAACMEKCLNDPAKVEAKAINRAKRVEAIGVILSILTEAAAVKADFKLLRKQGVGDSQMLEKLESRAAARKQEALAGKLPELAPFDPLSLLPRLPPSSLSDSRVPAAVTVAHPSPTE